MLKIEQQLVPSDKVLVIAGTNDQTSITVHETGNLSRGAGAKAHADLQSRGGFPASWHFQVDDKRIIQSYLLTTRCQHAGDGARGPGNTGSIAIEVCINEDSDRREAWRNTTDLVRWLMQEMNLPASAVFQHNNWSGKDCPMYLRRGNPITWATFKKTLSGATGTSTASSPKPKPKKSKGKQPYSHDQAAREVVEGKWGTGAERQRRLEEAGFVFNSVQRRVNAIVLGKKISSPAQKTTTQLAREVLDGKHGNGDDRRKSLGNRFDAVQREVNRLSRATTTARPPQKSNYQLATEVLQGKHGSGAARQKSLGSRYAAVQRIVNQRLR